jgi:hypothetical protein
MPRARLQSRLLALLLALAAGGCSSDLVGVRLIVTTDLVVPDDLDGVRLTVVAARTPSGPLCVPATVDATGIPFEFLVEKGTQFTGWVAFRVDGLRAGVTVVRREQLVRWPAEGVLDVPVKLQAACRAPVPPCDDARYECIDGLCVSKQALGIFDDRDMIEPGAPPCIEEP